MRGSRTYFYAVAGICHLMTLPTIMKNPLLIFNRIASVLCCVIFMLSCGDAGIGFNVSKELPVTISDITIPIPDIDAPDEIADLLDDVDPPSESLNYNLNEVGAFDDALGDFQGFSSDDILVNEMSYEITNISSTEEVNLDVLRITVNIGGSDLVLLEQTDVLSNQSKTPISLTDAQRSSIVDELLNAEQVNASVVFDLAEIPDSGEDIIFDFSLYFDVTLKARDL